MTLRGWRVEESGCGLRLIRCAALEAISGVAHAFSTRQGSQGNGTERFDLGSHEDRDPEIEARRRRFCDGAGLRGRRPTVLSQVHGARVLDAAEVLAADPPHEADGVVAARAGGGPALEELIPAVRWADCVPVLLAERAGKAVAAVHSGWRGTAAGVVAAAVQRLEDCGVRPAELIAAVGPAIGGCCYEVADEVLCAVAAATGAGPRALAGRAGTLDLRRAVRLQLERLGLEPAAIHVAPWCTYCREDLFFSYRREGRESGRQMACIGWHGR